MGTLPKKHAAAFYRAQKEVMIALRPYLARCLNQYFDKSSAIETFTVYSKEADAFEGRHNLRGCVTVWYGFPIGRGEECSVCVSFDAGLMGIANGDFGEMLAKAIPPLPAKLEAA